MPIISSQMRTNLVSLAAVNSDLAVTENRLATGKKINSALDNAAVFQKANGLSTRASSLEVVNQNISMALKNIKVAEKAITTMLSSLESKLTTMRDALTLSTGTAAAAVNVSGSKIFGTTAALARAASMVGTDLNNPGLFTDSEQFQISITTPTNQTKTLYLTAVNTMPATNGGGTSATDRFSFNTVQDLITAVTTRFGTEDITLAVTPGTAATTTAAATTAGRLNFTLTDPLSSLSIQQMSNTANSVSADLGQLFGLSPLLTTATAGQTITYAPTPPTTNADALATRAAAAADYRSLLSELTALNNDAFVPGQPNLLRGDTMTVALNDGQSTTATIRLPTHTTGNTAVALDTVSLGFALAANGTSTDATGNFATNTELSGAINKVVAGITKVKAAQRFIGTNNVMLTNRLEFNKTLLGALTESAEMLTAADATEEAATQAALQTRQAFAANNLSVTKQSEQSLIQILR